MVMLIAGMVITGTSIVAHAHDDSMDMSDHDDDGRIDSEDVDDDADGFPDTIEKVEFRHDHDNDGIKDSEDTDSDNDSIRGTPS